MTHVVPPQQRATAADRDTVAEILVGAFHADPAWAWACPDPVRRADQHRQLWRLLVAGALRHGSVRLNQSGTATAVWIPPGGTELSPEQETVLDELLDAWPAQASSRVRHAIERLEAAHPARRAAPLPEPARYLARAPGSRSRARTARRRPPRGGRRRHAGLPRGDQPGERPALPALRVHAGRLVPARRYRRARGRHHVAGRRSRQH